jgi:DNA-binding response OmpR family regulator
MENNGGSILVLDDDPDIGMMIRMMLEYKGYEVTVADRAEKAIQVLKSQEIALIIMDMLLSGSNGTDLCRTFKNDPEDSKIPIMMISAHPNAREICLAAGADEFIAKPFDMQDMLSKIKQLMKKN